MFFSRPVGSFDNDFEYFLQIFSIENHTALISKWRTFALCFVFSSSNEICQELIIQNDAIQLDPGTILDFDQNKLPIYVN